MLDVIDLECRYAHQPLFSALSFRLGHGEAVRVCGTNGSGKTSLLRMLCGLMQPAQGDVLWKGKSIGRTESCFAASLLHVGHTNGLKAEFTPFENLYFYAKMRRLAVASHDIATALAALGLDPRSKLPVKALSPGLRRRVALSVLLLGTNISLWILDEPFGALDCAGIAVVHTLLLAHLARGGLLVMTTHQDVDLGAVRTRQVTLEPTGRGA